MAYGYDTLSDHAEKHVGCTRRTVQRLDHGSEVKCHRFPDYAVKHGEANARYSECEYNRSLAVRCGE